MPSARLMAIAALTATALLVLVASASARETHLFNESFASAGSVAGQLNLADHSGIAINQETGDLYVADTGNHRVDQFEADGTFVRAFGADVGGTGVNVCTATCAEGTATSTPGGFEAPTLIAVDNSAGGEKDVYVGDPEAKTVSKFKADGTLIGAWGESGQLKSSPEGTFTTLAGVAVDSSGNLDLIENEPKLMLRFKADSTFIEAFETPRENLGVGLAIDSAGNFFKSNLAQSIEKFEASGADIGQVSLHEGATGLALDPSTDQLYVDTGSSIENYAFNGSGEVIEPPSSSCVIEPSVGCPATDTFATTDLGFGAGLAVAGSTHDVYAADAQANEILIFTPAILPDATTEAAADITRQTATLNGTVGAAGGAAATCAFQYETEAEYEANSVSERFEGAEEAPCNPAGPFTGSGTTAVSAALTNLSLETTYRFRLVATSVEGSNPGQALSFTTKPAVIVQTGEATAITDHGATLNGEIDPEGVELEACFFEYGTTTAYGQTVECAESPAEIGSGNGPVLVEAEVEGLTGGTEYHFRLAAKNSFGENQGADSTFTTPGPSITEEFATEVSATAATLNASINPNGAATTYEFQYVTDALFQQSGYAAATGVPAGGAAIGSGTTPLALSAQVQGLEPLTTYHYRVLATNSLGTTAGEDRAFTTQGPGSALLPDARQWEQVTPPNKFGSPLQINYEGGSVNQAAVEGRSFTADAHGPLAPGAAGDRSPQSNQWLSARGPAGWSTTDITAPREELAQIIVGFSPEYKQFSADLSRAIVEPEDATPLSPWATERTPYRREPNGEFVPLLVGCPAELEPCPPLVAEHANVPPGTEFGGELIGGAGWIHGVEFMLATPDLGHLLLSSEKLLTEDFQPGFEPNGKTNLYELSGAKLTLVSVLPDGKPASEADLSAGVGLNDQIMRGAISDDGRRAFFEAHSGSGERALYMRENATQPQSALDGEGHCTEAARACTIELDAAQPSATGKSGSGDFQGASADGSKVFFNDGSRLTADSTAAGGTRPDLYMCEISQSEGHPACALTDLSVALNPGEAGGVAGVVSAIDSSGDHVYFAAGGVLTNTPSPRGELALPGKCSFQVDSTCNLYSYDTAAHRLSFIAVLSQHDEPDWATLSGVDLGLLTARSSPDGRWFAFMSRRPLTGYDNRDARSGQPDEEVFLYDAATAALRCASCNPTGARPLGVFAPAAVPGLLIDQGGNKRIWPDRWLAASIPGWTSRSIPVAVYQSRYLSDSGRLFFNSSDALVPADTNGLMDVYQYEPPGVGDCTESSPTYSPASGGCVGLISSGTSPEESAFLDASESGDEAFFLTASKLASTDIDTALDVYDAHACSATSPCPPPPPPPPPACEGDACQPPAAPPNHPTPGTALLNGPGNLVECPKGRVKKNGKCVVRHERHKGKKHKHRAKHHRKGTVHP